MNIEDIILSKSIFKMFEIDLQAKPDSTFTRTESEAPDIGHRIYYTKKLDHKECDIFDELEIIITGENNHNAVLQGKEPSDGNQLMKILANITLTLDLLLGKDDKGKGILSPDDIHEYNIGVFQRNYMISGEHKLFVSLYNNSIDNVLCMTILGIKTKQD